MESSTQPPIRPRWWHNEDWLAVIVGGLLIASVLAFWRPALPRFHWMTASHFAAETRALQTRTAELSELQGLAARRGEAALAEALSGLHGALASGDVPTIRPALKQVEAVAAHVTASDTGKSVQKFIAPLQSKRTSLLSDVVGAEQLRRTLVLGFIYLVIAALAVRLLGGRAAGFAAGFPVVFALAWGAQLLAGNARINDFGLEYVIFALGLGLLLNHAFHLPDWLRQAVRTEFYIKSGLVILGTGILFQEILQAGVLGLAQAVLVVTVVWYFCFWVARRLRVDDEFAVMLSTAVSICGVSAAIAACGAIQGDRKKLSYVTSLVLIVALPMMVLMPWIVKHFQIPEIVAGAWLGGTLDTSGSVVAAGALISEPAMKTGVIVKFSQNVLLGVAAFGLSVWWTIRQRASGGQRPSVRLIWERFPKFVLGFIVASLVCSFALDPALVKETKALLTGLRNFWFALAFVSIGLETKFTDLVRMEGGRPAFAFIGAQGFNVVWTLILSWLLFGGVLVAVPDIR
ncbi:MAG: putative sulfate exporter family transporter [Verrucomicrobiae bacterium]|nr:putative sulfate exporter family transporter [Verrucomicrobiae bacterium]